MLITANAATGLVDDYSDFLIQLVQARWYFEGRFGSTRDDYIHLVDNIDRSLRALYLPYHINETILRALSKVREILHQKSTFESRGLFSKATDENWRQINQIFLKLANDERMFRRAFLAQKIPILQQALYPSGLYVEVMPLLNAEKYDACVVAAFKFLDRQVQRKLKLRPPDSYGEDLINLAFSPNTGRLQLNTHPNEQIGLRNFISGANALFRNPSAHRFVKFDELSGNAVITIVALMSRIIEQIKIKHKASIPRKSA